MSSLPKVTALREKEIGSSRGFLGVIFGRLSITSESAIFNDWIKFFWRIILNYNTNISAFYNIPNAPTPPPPNVKAKVPSAHHLLHCRRAVFSLPASQQFLEADV